MRIERAARKAQIQRPVVAEALHEAGAAAEHADRQSATERLAIGHDIGSNPEVFLRATVREAESDEDLIENEDDATPGADRPQLRQPVRVGLTIEPGAAIAGDERAVGSRAGVRMQRLQRVDQHTRNVVPRFEHAKAATIHVLQRVGVANVRRIARYPAAHRPTSRGTPRRSAPDANGRCETAPGERPA